MPESQENGPDRSAAVADGVEHPLHPSYVDLQRVIGWIVCAVLVPMLLIALLIALFVTALPVWAKALLVVAWIGSVVLLVWLAQRWPEVEYRCIRYRVDAEGIDIWRGVVWRKVISVPRSRVQHIDVEQGPLERRYGLGRLFIHTAGTEFAKVELPGLQHERALRLRDHLLPGRDHGAIDGV